MPESYKYFILGFLATVVITCLCFLTVNNSHDAAVFISQSIVDNAIFCFMFLIVVIITGISC